MLPRLAPALAVLSLGLAQLARPAFSAKPPPCRAGRFLLPPTTLLGGARLVVIEADRSVSIDGACEPVRAKRRASGKRTRLRVRWVSCAGLPAKLRLVATITDGCTRLAGALKVRGSTPVPFEAGLSMCGDGLVDPLAEECDGTRGCESTGSCDPSCFCRSADETTTTSTLTTTPSSTSTTVNAPLPLPGLPADVGGYETWLRLNAAPIPSRPGDPHNGSKDVFVNQSRDVIAPGGQQGFPYPDGSIVVKAATRPGRDFIGLIAIMRKRAGTDPTHNDWEFVEYTRAAANQSFALVARDAACWGCHAAAAATDYVFTPLQ